MNANPCSTLLDPDDTSGCVLDPCCELCAARDGLAVATLATTLGLLCLTICGECTQGPIPPLSLGDALDRVVEHCEHLDADLDEVSAALAAKDAR